MPHESVTPATHEPRIEVLKGEPTAAELAALICVIAAARDGGPQTGVQESNLWGHPVDKLRYQSHSWQRVTLLERTHMRR